MFKENKLVILYISLVGFVFFLGSIIYYTSNNNEKEVRSEALLEQRVLEETAIQSELEVLDTFFLDLVTKKLSSEAINEKLEEIEDDNKRLYLRKKYEKIYNDKNIRIDIERDDQIEHWDALSSYWGYGVTVDRNKALNIWKELMYDNNSVYIVARSLNTGTNIPRDINKAKGYFEWLIERNDSRGYKGLGDFYKRRDENKALDFYKRAEAMGNSSAMLEYVDILLSNGEYDKALEVLNRNPRNNRSLRVIEEINRKKQENGVE